VCRLTQDVRDAGASVPVAWRAASSRRAAALDRHRDAILERYDAFGVGIGVTVAAD